MYINNIQHNAPSSPAHIPFHFFSLTQHTHTAHITHITHHTHSQLREASRKALSSLNTVEAVDMKSPRMPAFERTVTQAAAVALEEWKKEAMMGMITEGV